MENFSPQILVAFSAVIVQVSWTFSDGNACWELEDVLSESKTMLDLTQQILTLKSSV